MGHPYIPTFYNIENHFLIVEGAKQCRNTERKITSETSSRGLFRRFHFFGIKAQQMSYAPWQEAHHDITVPSRGGAAG